MRNEISNGQRRLQMFITSRTKIIPDDAELYTQGHQYEGQCLFCKNPGATHPVISNNQDTFTQMCSWCYDEVEKEFATPIARKEIHKKDNLLKSLAPGHGFMLPPGINRFYQHLNASGKDYFAGLQQHCYICERPPSANMYAIEEFEAIEIPVRADTHIVGGLVLICDHPYCREAKDEYNNLLDRLGENKASKQLDKIEVSCPTCYNRHHIVGKEIYNRTELSDTYEWQCPQCAYARINRWEKDPDWQRFYPGALGEPRSELLPRFLQRVCSMCLEYTSIDFLQTEFSFCNNHIYNHNYICKDCSLLRTWFDLDNLFRIPSTRIYIEINQSDNSYSVFRLVRGKPEPLIVNGYTGSDNPIDNLLIAFHEVSNTLDKDLDGLIHETKVHSYNS